MKKRPTYRELLNTARDFIAEDLKKNPEDWVNPDHLEDLASEARDMVPDDGDFEWASSIYRESKRVREQEDGDGLTILEHMIGSIKMTLSNEMHDLFGDTQDKLGIEPPRHPNPR